MRINHEARAAAGARRRERTRAQLVDAAMRVIAEKGSEAASIADFAAAADVSRGVFYNYFLTQDALVMAVWDKVWESVDQEIGEAADGIDDPAEQIARACVRLIDECLANPVRGWVWLRLDATSALPTPRLSHHFLLFYGRGVEMGRFRPAPPAAATGLTSGGLRMAVRMALTGAASREVACQMVGMILAALGLDHAEAERLARVPAARQG